MAQEQTTSSHRSQTYQPIEDYAVIGNLYTVALVGKNGSIDWCCIPQFDAPSVFGALLDAQKGGFFHIVPVETNKVEHKQLYVPDTNILITRFLTADGVGEIIDFMPVKQGESATHQHHIMRSVQVVRGSMAFEIICRPAFNYARDPHETHLSEEGAVFLSETLCLALTSSVPLEEDGQGGARALFTLHQGQSVYFQLESAKDQDVRPHHHSAQYYDTAFLETKRYWQNWLSQCHPVLQIGAVTLPTHATLLATCGSRNQSTLALLPGIQAARAMVWRTVLLICTDRPGHRWSMARKQSALVLKCLLSQIMLIRTR